MRGPWFRLVLVLAIALAACRVTEASTTTMPATSTTQSAPFAPTTLQVPAITVPADFPATDCDAPLAVEEWPLAAAVELPGFTLPDGTERTPGLFRLMQIRGDMGGYAEAGLSRQAAFEWLPSSGHIDSRGVVMQHGTRYHVFEAIRFLPGDAPSTRVPCRLTDSQAVLDAWYAIQASLGGPAYWVWQEDQEAIQLAELVG